MVTKRELEALLDSAADGDLVARDELLGCYRTQLKRVISLRMDKRLCSRIDPSDVLQDTLIEAARRFPRYLQDRPIPFLPWIRQLAIDRVAQEHRKHFRAQCRNVRREEHIPLPDHSINVLAQKLMAEEATPSVAAIRREQRVLVREALSKLNPLDREVLELRFIDQHSTEEIAEIVGLTISGTKSRQRRALQRFMELLGDIDSLP